MRQAAIIQAFAVLFIENVCTFGQRDLGTIAATITDPQGAAVPDAKITITEDATGLSYEVVTVWSGRYALRPALKPGTYTVTAEAPGFRRVQQRNVTVSGGDDVGVTIVLPVGDVSQSVEVSAGSDSSDGKYDARRRPEFEGSYPIPLGGQRTFTFLARLSPGGSRSRVQAMKWEAVSRQTVFARMARTISSEWRGQQRQRHRLFESDRVRRRPLR